MTIDPLGAAREHLAEIQRLTEHYRLLKGEVDAFLRENAHRPVDPTTSAGQEMLWEWEQIRDRVWNERLEHDLSTADANASVEQAIAEGLRADAFELKAEIVKASQDLDAARYRLVLPNDFSQHHGNTDNLKQREFGPIGEAV